VSGNCLQQVDLKYFQLGSSPRHNVKKSLINRDNTPLRTTPLEWHCPEWMYGTDSGCDCFCGSWDPDCNSVDNGQNDCTEGLGGKCVSAGVCEYAVPLVDTNSGTCQDEDATPITNPECWHCEAHLFNDSLACNCECGLWDPDCLDPTLPIVGCRDVAEHTTTCSLWDGSCRWTPLAPSSWNCSLRSYGTDDGCDEGCGAIDPDCSRIESPASDCSCAAGPGQLNSLLFLFVVLIMLF